MLLPGCVVITAVRQPCGVDTEPELRLGLGASTFTPLPEDGRIPWEIGPQGGMHVTAALQTEGMDCGDPHDPSDEDDPVVTWVLKQGEVVVGGFEGLRRWLAEDESGAHEIVGEHLLLHVADPSDIEDRPLFLFGEVEDRCGRVATAEAVVEVVPPTEVPPPP